jgi:hypothetical protein
MDLPSDLIDLLAEFDAEKVEFALGPAEPLDVVWMGHPPHRIDLMKGVPGGDFEAAWRTRVMLTVAEVPVPVVSRAELIRLKRASGRPQDLVDAENLEAG